MKLKNMAALLLSGVMALSFAACGSSKIAPSDVHSVEDLDGKTVGVQTGTTGDLYISDDETLPNVKVERFSTGFEAVTALKQGKLDAVVIDDQPAQAFIRENEGLSILETEYVQEDYAICFAKGNAIAADVNAALAELKADGTLDQIVAAYINDAGKTGESYVSPADADHSKGTLVMATNAEFPPYEFKDDSGNIIGIDADLSRAIGDKIGYEVTIEDMKFDAIISAVTTGKADFGMAGMTVTEERMQSVDFSDSYYTGKQVIIVRS